MKNDNKHNTVMYIIVIYSLQVPDRPSRIQQVFQRGTKFRYSGRTFKQVQADEAGREEPPFRRAISLRSKKPFSMLRQSVLLACLLQFRLCSG